MIANYSSMYSQEELIYWHKRYVPNAKWNFENLILKKLNRNESAKAYGASLEFPLITDQELSNTPFSFYANVYNKKIYVPISSIKFIDDLSIAYAWLTENNYNVETIFDYVFCLKYGSSRFVDGKIPPPLKALHIPNDALNNKLVDDNSQKVLKSIIVWILSHELGHIIYKHPSYETVSFEQSQQFESDADSFATGMFKRIGTLPDGMVLLFTIFTTFFMNRGDYKSMEDYHNYLRSSTHPTSTDRLNLIADEFINYPQTFIDAEPNKILARQIVEKIGIESKRIVEIISSSKMQEFMRVRALAIDISSLFPRKNEDMPIVEKEYSENNFDDSDFSGIYHGIYSHKLAKGGVEQLNATYIFYKNKDKVNGRFSFGVGFGDIIGYLNDNKLTLNWKWGDASGKGLLSIIVKGEFFGKWGYGDEYTGGGSFQGKK